jgi:hypothetical protein
MPKSQLLSEPLTLRGIRIVQYGDSGVGKTVRASDAARWGLVEIHDFDEQGGNLRRYLQSADPARLAKIRIVSYVGATNETKVDHFAARIAMLADLRRTNKQPDIATLVVDSYSTLEQLYSEYLMSRYTPNATGFGSSRAEIEIGNEELLMPGTMDYSVLAVVIKKMFEVLKNTGINIILNCHEKDFLESKGTVIKQGTVKAAGQIRDMMPTEFNEFHRLFFNQGHRVQVKPNTFYLAKTALPGVPSNGILSDNTLKAFDDIAFRLP